MSYGFGRINDLAYEAYQNAKSKGFWDTQDPRHVTIVLSKLALITSEVGEAVEAIRHNDELNFAEELADICIRVFDLAEARGINLEQAIVNKMTKNSQRGHMHGKLA